MFSKRLLLKIFFLFFLFFYVYNIGPALCGEHADAQVPSSIIFVKKMVQRCGVWQIKRVTSPDQDQVSMKSNMFGFRGYLQMKFYKTYKTAKTGLVW